MNLFGTETRSRSSPDSHAASRIRHAFRREDIAGLRVSIIARTIALFITSTWLFVWTAGGTTYFLLAMMGILVVNGWAYYIIQVKYYRFGWVPYAFVLGDLILVALSMFGSSIFFAQPDFPPQMQLRNGLAVYYFIFIAAVGLNYSPWLVIWSGFCCCLVWAAGVGWMLTLPNSIQDAFNSEIEINSVVDFLEIHLSPYFVDLNVVTQDMVVMMIVAGIVAATVHRARRMVIREATSERERANLARYFAPTMVDKLQSSGVALESYEAQPVAVLFADIVGFTKWSETANPVEMIQTLRAFHSRLEAAVFRHSGTLDKFLGDGVMATFGTPTRGERDASNALLAARDMLRAIDDWNAERAVEGKDPIRLSIGLHYGEAVLGDIGSARRLEFAVLGDVVNVASRLEAMSRSLNTRLVVSAALIEAAATETAPDAGFKLDDRGEQHLPGRDRPISVWTATG